MYTDTDMNMDMNMIQDTAILNSLKNYGMIQWKYDN